MLGETRLASERRVYSSAYLFSDRCGNNFTILTATINGTTTSGALNQRNNCRPLSSNYSNTALPD